MKLSLVATQGKGAGKVIPIPIAEFLIGRDAQCHLRPASPLISKRHCALLVRGDKAFVRDFGSTNGTHVNDQPVNGEVELHNEDRLRVGPLAFIVRVETVAPASKPVPKSGPRPEAKTPAGAPDEDCIGDMLLGMGGEGPGAGTPGVEDDSVLSTVLEMPALPPGPRPDGKSGTKPADKKDPPVPKESSSFMARKILDKYRRRPS